MDEDARIAIQEKLQLDEIGQGRPATTYKLYPNSARILEERHKGVAWLSETSVIPVP